MGEIHKKLQKIQHQLKVPKSRWNKFGKFWYRSLEDIYEAVKPLLDEQGLILTVHDEIIMMGNRFYIKATAKLTDIEDEKNIVCSAYAREEETRKGVDSSQITGATSTAYFSWTTAKMRIRTNTKAMRPCQKKKQEIYAV